MLSLTNSELDSPGPFTSLSSASERGRISEIMAAVASQERRMISRRTKDALAAAEARGVKLGGYRHDGLNTKLPALKHAESLRETFAELAGLSHRAAAKALNVRGIPTATGKNWTAVQVTRVRERLGLAPAPERT